MFCFNSLYTFTGWPYFTEEDIFAFRILPNGLLLEINIDSTGQCVGDNQQWRCQIVCWKCFNFWGVSIKNTSCVGMNSTFEVSVSGKNSTSNKLSLFNCTGDWFWEWSRITNTCHATITNNIITWTKYYTVF